MYALSVVIPVFNRELYIGDAIESVLAQETDFSVEVIVSDDASRDGTAEVVRSYGDRIRLIQATENRGAAAARNAGIRAAKSSMIALLDSDDLMLPGRLQVQHDFLSVREDVGLVTGACEHESGEPATNYYRNRGLDVPWGEWLILDHPRAAVARGFVGNPSTTTVRKSLLENIGYYNERLTTLEDWELLFRAASATKFAFYNWPLAWMRTSHPGRLGRSVHGAMEAPDVWRQIMEATDDLLSEEREALSKRHASAVRGAMSAAYLSQDRAALRTLLRRYSAMLDTAARCKWMPVSMLPFWVTRPLLRMKSRVTNA
jgi:glycosyltransferase involved in cell wall biosynthesis